MSNLQKIKTLIKAPHADDNPFIMRKINLLNTLLWMTLSFTILYCPVALLIVSSYAIPILLNLSLGLATIAALIIFRKGRFYWASITLLIAIWAYMSLTIFFFGGVVSPATISFVFLILASGLLLEEWGILALTTLSVFSCTLVWFLELNGRLQETVTIESSRYWFATVIVLIVSAGLFYTSIRSLNKALEMVNCAKEELAQLIAAQTKDLTIVNEKLLAEMVTREQVENAFEESEQRFQHLFNSSPDAMFLMDPHHPEIPWMIVECNQAACKMNGYTRDELVGKSIFILDANPDPTSVKNTSVALYRDRTIFFEGSHIHKDGHIFPIEVALTVVTIGGNEYLLGQDREITRRREAEEALHKAHAELEQRVAMRTADLSAANKALHIEMKKRQKVEQARQQLIEELEAKNKELEQFAYTVSHDLKSPLITIRGFLNFIERDLTSGKPERALNDLQRIISATDNMQSMLENLLELSRIGLISNPPTAVSLNQIITEALERLDGSVRERGVSISCPMETPPVFVDAERLTEVFQNLIGNAVKFMGDQPDPQIDISIIDQTESEITCAVKDNGIGISAKDQQQVFDLFKRVNEDIEGTGIGLALVKRIVEVHNGRVWVESDGLGHGSTFLLTLPKPITNT